MATFDTFRTTNGTFAAVTGLRAGIASLTASVIAWNDARVTRAALADLTDRELEDIGLVRGDIDSVAQSTLIR